MIVQLAVSGSSIGSFQSCASPQCWFCCWLHTSAGAYIPPSAHGRMQHRSQSWRLSGSASRTAQSTKDSGDRLQITCATQRRPQLAAERDRHGRFALVEDLVDEYEIHRVEQHKLSEHRVQKHQPGGPATCMRTVTVCHSTGGKSGSSVSLRVLVCLCGCWFGAQQLLFLCACACSDGALCSGVRAAINSGAALGG
eukprot:COSAG06_NODE_2072_length_7660_cov_2.682449_3_plen_196_part_00